jgi:TFIIF-interacting CTD phosphatase-like protein
MLESLRKEYELVLFTAASQEYADIVLQTFEGKKYFDHVLSRNQCIMISQFKVYVKDLSILLNGRSL